MDPGDRRFENDAFAPSRLPMARQHPPLPGRGRLYAAGGIALLLVALPFLTDAFIGNAGSISNGPLSENHALFGDECGTCHTPGEGTPDAKCRSCHEKAGDPMGVYGFARHYLYRSADFDRSSPASQELSCASCHTEHQGADRSLSRVADAKCSSCHEVGGFGSGHPEFDFAAESLPDAANLRFAHVQHVREIVEEEELSDIEASCLECHEPEPDGRSFRPVSFSRHCDDCHLEPGTATPLLPLASARGNGPGVRTLDLIRREAGGIAAGAEYWDPNEFRERGGRIFKRPVYHEDPWVLYNLEQLRRQLYPGAELAELLRASADVPPEAPRVLHDEAIATLRARIQILRGEPSPDVQDELQELERLLQLVEQRLEDPYSPVDRNRFDVRVADRSPLLESGELDEGEFIEVVDSLTSPCQSCHIVERATIGRVQTDQRTLVRAEFDHRAHIIHARCLDCHTAIPVRDWVGQDDDPPAGQDEAGIQNLPTIETCRSCHSSGGPPDRCTTCHLFHPDQEHWSNLSRYRRPAR